MQMLHRLATVLSAVGDDTVAVYEAFGGGDLGDDLKDAGHVGGVVSGHLVGGGHVDLGNHEDVGGGHGRDVAEGVHHLVLVHLGRGDIPRDDLTE